MAGKARHSSAEFDPEWSVPTPSKQIKLDVSSSSSLTGNSTDENVSEANISLETNEQLSKSFSSEEESDDVQQLRIFGDNEAEKNANVTVNNVIKHEETKEKQNEEISNGKTSSNEIIVKKSVQMQQSLMGEHAVYQDLSLIGDGAYGTVYKAKDLTNGQVVALKKVRVPLTEDGLPMSTLREIATLKQLERFEHPHIVRLLDVCHGNYLQMASGNERAQRNGLTLWLVFEHVDRDLASYMSAYRSSHIPPQLVKQMSREILLGVDFLHSHRIIHRDLKPQNLLVTKEGRIKIADFGLAKTYDFEMRLTSVVVTLWYRSPEVLLGCSYASSVDVWSIGCILAELHRLKPLFPGTSEGDQLDRIFSIIGTPSQQEWPENVSLSLTAFPSRQPMPFRCVVPNLNNSGLDLIKSMLHFNPHNRPSAADALKHAYFTANGSR